MREGLYSNQFSEVFLKLLEKSGASCYRINKYSGVDQAHLSRLKNGEKGNPSPEIVMRIALGLVHCSNRISLHDVEELLNATGRTLRIN